MTVEIAQSPGDRADILWTTKGWFLITAMQVLVSSKYGMAHTILTQNWSDWDLALIGSYKRGIVDTNGFKEVLWPCRRRNGL